MQFFRSSLRAVLSRLSLCTNVVRASKWSNMAYPMHTALTGEGGNETLRARTCWLSAPTQVIQLPPITLDNCHEREDGDLQWLSLTVRMATWDLERARAPFHGRNMLVQRCFYTCNCTCAQYMYTYIYTCTRTYIRT